MKVVFEGTIEELAAFGVRLDKMIRTEDEEGRAKAGEEGQYISIIRTGQIIEAIKLYRTMWITLCAVVILVSAVIFVARKMGL